MSDDECPWREEDKLRELRDNGLTYEEMADELGCSRRTIARWMKQYDLNGFLNSHGVYQYTAEKGYEQVLTEGGESVYVHQLIRLLNDEEPDRVFSDNGLETHHVIPIPWLNVSHNVAAVSEDFHQCIHAEEQSGAEARLVTS